jgi:hypothetical protein
MIQWKQMVLGATVAVLPLAGAMAQDSGALVDALVKKGILTDQEAEDIRADLTKEFAQTPAGKLNIASHITQLKLSGDARLRWQYDGQDVQAPAGVVNDRQERTRNRIRVRLNADYNFTENFSAGVGLETAQASDSGNQTIENGFEDASIFLSKYFLKWQATDWLALTGGKQPNPFYTTDLVWDADINPTGGSERIELNKAFDMGNFSAALVAGQFIFDDNTENALNPGANQNANNDPWMFYQQAVLGYDFKNASKLKVTIAPGFMTYLLGGTAGLNSEGAINAETAHLHIITAPGDVSWTMLSKPFKFYWDFAYNTDGGKRIDQEYGLVTATANRDLTDNVAWLAGLSVGENKKKGDWMVRADYRVVGLGSIDPNINDSDFALSNLNQQGVVARAGYNFTDFLIGNVAFYTSSNYKGQLNQATVASRNSVQVLQVDLNWKF